MKAKINFNTAFEVDNKDLTDELCEVVEKHNYAVWYDFAGSKHGRIIVLDEHGVEVILAIADDGIANYDDLVYKYEEKQERLNER